MQVWLYDENKLFTESTFADEISENMTTVPYAHVGYIKPTFNEDTQEWIEGATQEEIDEFNREEESSTPPQEPNEIQIRLAQYEQALGLLATQLAKNTLLQNQGGATI